MTNKSYNMQQFHINFNGMALNMVCVLFQTEVPKGELASFQAMVFGSDRSPRSQDIVRVCVRPSGTLLIQAFLKGH